MKDHEAKNYSNTKNRFIAVLRSAMKRDVEKKILLVVELMKSYGAGKKESVFSYQAAML